MAAVQIECLRAAALLHPFGHLRDRYADADIADAPLRQRGKVMPRFHHSDGTARLRRKAVGHFSEEGVDFAVSNQVRAEGEHVHRAHIQIFLHRVLVGMEHMPASVLQHGQRIQIGKLMAVCLGHTVIENLPVPNDHARDGLSADAIGVVIRVHPPDSLILFCNQRSLHMLALRFLRVVKNTAHALCV